MASPLIQAALSHYIAKRDKCLAELDIYLNKPVGVGEHATITEEVIKLFAELDNAESIISTIQDVISSNQNKIELLRQDILQKIQNPGSEEVPNSDSQN